MRECVDILRFRRGICYIIDVPSRVRLGRILVIIDPNVVDEEFEQDLFLPGNADCGGKSGLVLIHTNGASPLLEKKRKRVSEDLQSGGGYESVPDQRFR